MYQSRAFQKSHLAQAGLLFSVSFFLVFGEPSGRAAEREPSADAQKLRTVTIRAQVPPEVGRVYLTGNRPELGNWNPNVFAMNGTNRERVAVLHVPLGTQLEYKFT